MMKKITITAVVAGLLWCLTVSCQNDSDKARDFALDIGEKISKNMLDSVRLVYPDAVWADSLALKFNPEQINIEESETPGRYIVEYDPGVTVTFDVGKDRQVRIVCSKGIFAWNDETVRLAKTFGLISDELSDKDKAEQIRQLPKLMDLVYDSYKKNNVVSDPIVVGEFVNEKTPLITTDEGRGYYPLTNKTDHDIKGSEYQVSILQSAVLRFAANGEYEEHLVTRPGIDIPAGGTARYNVVYTQFSDNEVKGVKMKTKSREEYLRDYKPTGNEYKLLETKQ